MSKVWLVLDCDYLCYRALHSGGRGKLSFNEIPTGVTFGFLRDMLSLQDLHATNRMVFCFDYGKCLRKVDFPGYKKGRHDGMTEQEQLEHGRMRKQIKLLRAEYLPSLGYQNVLYQRGYEADDIIASVVQRSIGEDDRAIIVSSDHDLYQLLDDRVRIWNPTANKTITAKSFYKTFGCSPASWIDIKAIAGCGSDKIPGIQGVGPKTAALFLCGNLSATLKSGKPRVAFDNIVRGNKIWRRNKALVKLPYPGCQVFKLKKDYVKEQRWERLADQLGFKTLKDRGHA